MISKLSIIGSPLSLDAFSFAFWHMFDAKSKVGFTANFGKTIQSNHVITVNSGIASFYIILEALKEKSTKNEVILPAYTAGSLVVAVKKAGLKPVLCDINLDDFSLDVESLLSRVSNNTLAVVAVHMFGLPLADIAGLKGKLPSDVFLLEDCAQAMGTTINNKLTGSFSDISFYSFNRGKNLPLCSGGAISTQNQDLSGAIDRQAAKLSGGNLFRDLIYPFQLLVFSFSLNPYIYGALFFLISCFKETKPPKDFPIRAMSNFHSAYGLKVLQKENTLFSKRNYNGMYLANALKDLNNIILPKTSKEDKVIFNRLPVIFKDLKQLKDVQMILAQKGIESSRMYNVPLNQMFDLGYGANDFPNASYLAEHLLTLPVHPLVENKDLDAIIEAIKGV
ncbi:MAG: DegT/DnrJ/EryC1/StrS family aminotransferase [Candidatus Omnitrophica bacterium]|nr:DegT/DnrJ/EryC1/StrS family aminotransferase [Candidatus Omnitrophota bacterium]